MSRRSCARARVALLVGAGAVTARRAAGSSGRRRWFPQMKWQKAVQAFERSNFQGRDGGLPAARGRGAGRRHGAAGRAASTLAALDALVNPRADVARARSRTAQGRYTTYCAALSRRDRHGRRPGQHGLPGPARALRRRVPAGGARHRPQRRTHLQRDPRTGRRRGCRATSASRPSDRWDIVNYVRYLTIRREASRERREPSEQARPRALPAARARRLRRARRWSASVALPRGTRDGPGRPPGAPSTSTTSSSPASRRAALVLACALRDHRRALAGAGPPRRRGARRPGCRSPSCSS